MTAKEAIDYLLDPIGKREQHDEAIRMAISALEKQDVPGTNVGDMISRKAVLEINERYHGKMPNEINHKIWREIKALPSAQPEIVRCKNCKHHHYDSKGIPYCDRIDYGYGWKDDDFCSKAERKTDE